MFNCPNCGSQLNDGAQFCNFCGSPITANVTPAYAVPQGAAIAKPKKKTSPFLIIGIIVGFLVLVGVVLFSLRAVIAKAVMGDVAYYAYSEMQTFEELLANEEFAELLKVDELSVEAEGELIYDGEKSSANMKFDCDTEHRATGSFDVSLEGDDYGPVLVNIGAGKIGFSAPSVTDESVTIPMKLEPIDTDKYSDLVKDFYPVIKDIEKNRLDSKITKSKEVVNGERCKVTTVTLSESDMLYICADFLEALNNNPALLEACKDEINKYYSIIADISDEDNDLEEAYNDFISEIPETIRDCREDADELKKSGNEDTVIIKIAYKNSHFVLQRQLIIEDTVYTVTTNGNRDNAVIDITYEEDGKSEEVVRFSKTNAGGKTNFSLYSKVDDDESFTLTGTDITVDSIGGVKVPTGELVFAYEEDEFIANIKMGVTDKYEISFEALEDNENIFTGKINANLNDSANMSAYLTPDDNASGNLSEFFEEVFDY